MPGRCLAPTPVVKTGAPQLSWDAKRHTLTAPSRVAPAHAPASASKGLSRWALHHHVPQLESPSGSHMATLSPDLDILVIGAGQAGLALGFHLKRMSFRFQLVDRNSRVGDSWRKRFDSLVLFTPRAYSALPGLAVPGDPDTYPTKDEMADYLEAYANHFDLPVVSGTGIRRLERKDGGFRATTDSRQHIDCRAVVSATDAFQRPAVPAISKQLSASVFQLSPENYEAPAQFPPGRVLVAGDGATGREIASELSVT